jgi:hypothetical protein
MIISTKTIIYCRLDRSLQKPSQINIPLINQYHLTHGMWGYTVCGAIRYMGLYGIWGYTVYGAIRYMGLTSKNINKIKKIN